MTATAPNPQRRRFLQHTAVAGLGAALPWSWMNALAATPGDDYKALVCVFLFGGNDGNNLIVPNDSSSYANYASLRGGLALAQSSLLSIKPPSQGGKTFGLHPALSALQPLWQQGKLAVQCNVGTLINPITVTQYKANRNVAPTSLFSHSDQQGQWQSSESAHASRSGWGGRLSDLLGSAYSGGSVPMAMSTAGTNLFVAGNTSLPLAVPSSGGFGLTSSTGSSTMNSLLTLDRSNVLVDSSSALMQSALTSSAVLSPILSASTSTALASFNGLTTSTAKQLLAVAKIIAARQALGATRQIFFVAQNGYDTHSNQISVQNSLLTELGNALAAFYTATSNLGVADKVVSFTASDFGRTLKANATNGSDHAWGNHHLVLGGAVKGGDFYGTFPSLTLNGADDVDGSGRWLPSTSVDQYAATFANWFGASSAQVQQALPNLAHFGSSALPAFL